MAKRTLLLFLALTAFTGLAIFSPPPPPDFYPGISVHAADEGVTRIDENVPPQPGYGTAVSQGVALHNAAAWHNNGYKGKGVKIGIIDYGFQGWRSLQGTELPSALGGARCYTDRDGNYGGLEVCDAEGQSWNGTAVGEAIMDVAPEATLYLAEPQGSGSLQQIVQWMSDEGVQVINMSLTWLFDGPGDGTSPYNASSLQAVDQAVSEGIIWVNRAGNNARETWYGAFADSDNDTQHEWDGTDESQDLDLQTGDRVTVQLRWDDQWGGADKDLDVSLELESTDAVVASSRDRQDGEADDVPYERIRYVVPADGGYDIKVRLHSGSAPSWLQLMVWSRDNLQHYTNSGSVINPAESANPGLLAVGATHYYSPDRVYSRSGRGPAPDGRVKPDIVGVDCAQVAIVEKHTSGGLDCWYAGTSQASAHVAGLAALVAEQYPRYTPVQIANYLKTNAADRGDTGPDNTWGHGFAQLPAPPDCVDNLTADGATTGTWASGCQSHVASPDPNDGDGTSYSRYYTFTTTEQKTVTISLDSDEDTYLYLRQGDDTRSGAVAAENDDKATGNTNSEISRSLAAGTYTIEATTYEAATSGSFTLTISGLGSTGGGTPPPATDTCTDTITADGATSGTWAAGCQSAETGRGYARYYSFTTTEAKDLTIVLDSTVDTYLYLRSGDKTGAITAQNDDHGTLVSTAACANSTGLDNTDSCITITGLAAGGYTIEATTYATATTGSFTLTIAGLDSGGGGTPPPADTCTDSITADGTTSSSWTSGCQSAETGRGYARYYSFTTTEAKDVTITLSSTVDTYLYLRSGDKTGAITAQNDDHGTLLNTTTACANSTGLDTRDSCITVAGLAAGSYTIEATTYATATTGSFTLTISGLSAGGGGTPPPADTCTDAITADGTTSGTWASDCQSAETGRGYARYYSFTTTESKDVTIVLDSTVDTYLYLRSGDKTGTITAQNDDHGTLVGSTTACANSTGLDSTDSCITITGLSAGSYTIEATTYATNTAGDFTLTIAGLGAAPLPACTLNQELTPGQSCTYSAAGVEAFTVAVKDNGNLTLEFTGSTAPPTGLFFTRSGNDWTINGLP